MQKATRCCGSILLAALLLVLAACHAAAQAPLGSYLGCFDPNRLIMRAEDQKRVWNLTQVTLPQCRVTCSKWFYPLAIIGTDFSCRCSWSVPDNARRLPDSRCQPGSNGMAVFYMNQLANSTSCRIAEVPMRPDAWNVAYGDQNVVWEPREGGVMRINLAGTQGARLIPKDGDHLYGTFEIRAQTTCAPGAVTAFYTRSSDIYPNEAAGDFSEIDWEWLNANPAKEQCSLWLNAQQGGKGMGERLIGPAEYQKLMGWPKSRLTNNSWATYSINWQPGFVTFALDGRRVRTMQNGEKRTWTTMGGNTLSRAFVSPDKPSHATISLWTDDRWDRPESQRFGGILDTTGGPYPSRFKNMRRVLCDVALPAGDAALTAAVRGPAWLY
ncbi:hypothetical protein OEZ86_008991 [Tetradesmus obliquus]|nr:hypothetical protein OEZ86_008991 [Tetradesmus obliquus]